MSNPVFVYGTLKKGMPNHSLLESSKFLGRGRTAADKFVMRSCGGYYPSVKEELANPAKSYIKGEIYLVDDETLDALDALEGNGYLYERILLNVVRSSGEGIPCWMYCYLPDSPKSQERVLVSTEGYEWRRYD